MLGYRPSTFDSFHLIVNFKLLGFLKSHRLDTQVKGKIGRKIWTFSLLKMTITQLLIGLELFCFLSQSAGRVMLKIMKPAKNSVSGTFILPWHVLHCTEHFFWICGSETFETIPYMTMFFLSLQIYHKKRVTSVTLLA